MKVRILTATVEAESVIRKRRTMRRDLKERIRQRIQLRLDELHMTGRQLARSVRPDEAEDSPDKLDSWMSSILTGRAALTWEYIDAVCDTLRMTPGELVRWDDSDMRELSPREMHLLRHYQGWPRDVQERWISLLDYFRSTMPDPQTARLLDLWRNLPLPDRRRALHLLEQSQTDIPPHSGEHGSGPRGSNGSE